jgi:predicted MFS family arabinose efflux permease
LGFGIANLIGSACSRYLLEWNMNRSLSFTPLAMALMAGGLVAYGNQTFVAAILIAIWGLALGIIQVGWTAWLTRTAPDEAETGGGIQIAVIQLAITTGAALGGILFDYEGVTGVFAASSIFALVAAILAKLAFSKAAVT